MVVSMRRGWSVVSIAIVAWTAPLVIAQPARPASEVDALATEFGARQTAAAGRVLAPLPTPEQAAADAAWADGFLGRLHRLQPDALSHDDWITYAMLEVDAGVMKDAAQYFWFDIPITPYASPLRSLAGTFAAMPLASDANRQAFLDALHQVPVMLASYDARLRSQVSRGIVAPAEELRLVLPFIRGFGGAAASSVLRPKGAAVDSLAADTRTRFLEQVDASLDQVVAPAVERLATFIDTAYRAKAPAAVGLAQYPGGRDYYQFLVRRHTGLTLTPGQIHEIGLAEVSRLEGELDTVRQQAGFAGSLADFHVYLRSDTRFLARSADDIAERMMRAIARIEPKVDAWFPIKPNAPYGVRRLDPALEGSMTYGYYQMPAGAERSGYYLFNGFTPEQRSVLMAEAVIYHELVPGHHFQIALQRENTALNAYRRTYGFTAFTEGWGEYASDVAGEMGMYADPYARAGRLAMDLFLSTRLVLDTGMNALGWPREKAMAFMREHTFESDLQIDTETLRYSADYHGQALAYKMGARKIHELRDRAARAQGTTFDLPAFHAWVLRGGAMPLTVLDGHVSCFVHERHVRRSAP